MAYYNSNQSIINQLMRQKDNIDNMISQYQQMPQQAPIQNIINQTSNVEFEARFLKENEDPMDIVIMRKTLFIDEANKKITIKEIDGTISKTYDIIVPLDKKDQKILELENKIKEMEERINVEYPKPNRATSREQEFDIERDGIIESTATADSEQSTRTTRRKTSRSDS